MKQHYVKIAKRLAAKRRELEVLQQERDLAALHRFVVDLKTCLPERLSYENSPLLLEGLRINQPDAMPDYVERLRNGLDRWVEEYKQRV